MQIIILSFFKKGHQTHKEEKAPIVRQEREKGIN